MEIGIGNNCEYKYVELKEGNTTIETGLLDKDEALDVAKEFISAAEDLLPIDNDDLKEKLIEIREAL
jgi:hypothetical protein